MSFTLRQITQRAGGGEIVRARTIEAAELTIGRGADCELQLPDLAVSLRHARLTQTGPSQVAVEAFPGLDFEAGGRFTNRASLEVSQAQRLIFGGHGLTFARGAAAGEIVVTIERLATIAPKADDDAVRSLAPGSVGLNKRRAAYVLGLLVVVLCIVLPIGAFYAHQNTRIHLDQQWTSGPLSKAHAFLEKDCQTCHQSAFVAVRDGACQTCHQAGRPAGVQAAANARVRAWGGPDNPHVVGGHADFSRLMRATPLPADIGGKIEAVFRRTFNHPDTRCASCHREHLDADGRKVPLPKATTAPKPTMRRPDKPILSMAQDCAQCHGGMKSRLPDTELIDVADWSGHPDFRPLVMVSPAGPQPLVRRIALRLRPRETSGLTFDHSVHLSPTGGVARLGQVLGAAAGYGDGGLKCAACHRPDATGQGFKPIEMTRDCGACHSLAYARVNGVLQMLPHGRPDLVVARLSALYASGGSWSGPMTGAARTPALPSPSAVAEQTPAKPTVVDAVRRTFSLGGACYDCHRVIAPSGANPVDFKIAPVKLTDRYLPWGAFNHAIAAHRVDAAGRETCNSCHKARTSRQAEDLLLPRIDTCFACHGKTKDQTPQAAGAACAECHGYHTPGRPARLGESAAIATTSRSPAAPG